MQFLIQKKSTKQILYISIFLPICSATATTIITKKNVSNKLNRGRTQIRYCTYFNFDRGERENLSALGMF